MLSFKVVSGWASKLFAVRGIADGKFWKGF
jgi:hypothetical protein